MNRTAITAGIVRNATERMSLTKNAATAFGTAKSAKRHIIRMKRPFATANEINPGTVRNITSVTSMPMYAMKSVVIATEQGVSKFINPKQIVRTPGGVQRTTIGTRRAQPATETGSVKPV